MSFGDPFWSIQEKLTFSFMIWGIYKDHAGGECIMPTELGRASQVAASWHVVVRSRVTGKTNWRGAKWSELTRCCLAVRLARTELVYRSSGIVWFDQTMWSQVIQLVKGSFLVTCPPLRSPLVRSRSRWRDGLGRCVVRRVRGGKRCGRASAKEGKGCSLCPPVKRMKKHRLGEKFWNDWDGNEVVHVIA